MEFSSEDDCEEVETRWERAIFEECLMRGVQLRLFH
jgi:hypothetical protein